ncbi:hypothetical protein NDN08_004929 [Rhodosorus marinus]|uniref:Protein phosphatase 1 regulatory subunit 11 n=1 Tax=Rhodosorus marinus TaxID=101924 RepID=A0AAV8UF08_9RHOD|nr:hypothetical protein NDN08_004929 [Rhodosorus marinus]
MRRERERGGESVVVTSTTARSDREEGGQVLKLRLRSRNGQRVAWTEETHDNEHDGKKKSKKCCIFHKQRAFDESSSGSESDSSSSSGGGPSAPSSEALAQRGVSVSETSQEHADEKGGG